ncbi:HlyD family secretion protein [Anaerovirgula multivorans]|uniref:HlyD family secretion protein n=1 Tax=Anaerovirgula multivorans TaxID=312168 RepID=A0A239DAL6_9FIRM|nr:HlyD family efflux transporter periplasmic adaptor subunit [Anaerovirgula multivorans]SNS28743.1 HlyD family secretion protein [Anaerovirgula multivorans]
MKRKKSNKNKTMIIGIVCVLIAALMIGGTLRPQAESYNEETVRKQDIETYYRFNGNIEAKNRQMVIAESMMQIKTIHVEEGDIVEKDDILVESTQGQQIKAKIDGQVGEVLIEESATLMAGANMVTLTDYSDLQVVIKVDEYDIASLSPGQEVTVLVNALGEEITGEIAKVSKEATSVNDIAYFTASIDLEDHSELLMGMSTEVSILSQSAPNATTLSMKALQFDHQNQPFVYYRDNSDKVVTKAVKVGINDGNTVEILEGVKIGEVVLIPRDNRTITSPSSMMRNQ